VPAVQAPEVLVFPVLQYEEPDSEQKGLEPPLPAAITALIIKTILNISASEDNIIIMAFFIIF
jgi:hypothetical protein